jgi:hypothetical protein
MILFGIKRPDGTLIESTIRSNYNDVLWYRKNYYPNNHKIVEITAEFKEMDEPAAPQIKKDLKGPGRPITNTNLRELLTETTTTSVTFVTQPAAPAPATQATPPASSTSDFFRVTTHTSDEEF